MTFSVSWCWNVLLRYLECALILWNVHWREKDERQWASEWYFSQLRAPMFIIFIVSVLCVFCFCFVCLRSVSCAQWWVYFWIRYFFIDPSVFSNVYLWWWCLWCPLCTNTTSWNFPISLIQYCTGRYVSVLGHIFLFPNLKVLGVTH